MTKPVDPAAERLATLMATDDATALLEPGVSHVIAQAVADIDWALLDDQGPGGARTWQAIATLALVHVRRSRLLPDAERGEELRRGADLMAVAYAGRLHDNDGPLRKLAENVYGAAIHTGKVGPAWNAVALSVFNEAERERDGRLACRAAELFRHAVRAEEPDGPHLGACLINLGNAQAMMFSIDGDEQALDEAVVTYRRAQELSVDRDHRAALLSNLGAALVYRYRRDGDERDLREAVDAQREAVAISPEEKLDVLGYLSNVGTSLTSLFERTGDEDTLNEAVNALHRSVARTPPDDPDGASRLMNLALALIRYFEHTADAEALQSATGCLTRMLELTPQEHPDLPSRLGNASAVWIRGFDLVGDVSFLDAAAEALEEALRAARRPNPDYWSNLGIVHQRRFDATGDSASLATALRAYEEAVSLIRPEAQERATYLSNLGNTLTSAHETTGDGNALDRAVAVLEEAVSMTVAGDPSRAVYLINLGSALEARHDRGGARRGADAQAALRAYDAAARLATAPALTRARAARKGARLAARTGRNRAALEHYVRAVDLLNASAWRGLDRLTQERLLREFAGLAGDAAACALTQDRVELAVELLEQGRGVLLGQALDARTDDDLLRSRHPEHASRLERLHRFLDREPIPDDLTVGQGAKRATIFGAYARERDKLLSKIRDFDGFADFLKAPHFGELRAAAAEGPVVIVNVSAHRCDALIVSSSGVRVLSLPRLTLEGAQRAAELYVKLVRRARNHHHRSVERGRETSRAFHRLLAWLWESVTGPVLSALGLDHRDDDWPRLWWCPTGPLSLLPLHAAQRYDPARLTDTGVCDRVVSSYTPTLRALMEARRGGDTDGPGSLLAVCVPDVPGLAPLPQATTEVDALTELPRLVVLRAAEATTEATKHEMLRHADFHFVGHSVQDPRHPGRARIFLHDGPLTMRDISRFRLTGARFAFLSSCESGLGGIALPDEALHLAGALQLVGYRSVIATFWTILDGPAPEVARRVYARHAEGHRTFATTLHRAVRELRTANPPQIWAAYFHTGV